MRIPGKAFSLVAGCAFALAACGGGGGTPGATGPDVGPLAGAASAKAAIRAPDGDWTQFGYDAQRSGVWARQHRHHLAQCP